jgi:hypothetical protein
MIHSGYLPLAVASESEWNQWGSRDYRKNNHVRNGTFHVHEMLFSGVGFSTLGLSGLGLSIMNRVSTM